MVSLTSKYFTRSPGEASLSNTIELWWYREYQLVHGAEHFILNSLTAFSSTMISSNSAIRGLRFSPYALKTPVYLMLLELRDHAFGYASHAQNFASTFLYGVSIQTLLSSGFPPAPFILPHQ